MVQIKVSRPMLLAERFISGGGWMEVLVISLYAAAITWIMVASKDTMRWRLRIWTLFSIAFFLQLILGMLGIDRLLMTGTLHWPIPALIAATPIYRGEGLFMPILFASTLLLVGPAWCSHLCYFGAWDNLAAQTKKRPAKLPRYRHQLRILILLLIFAGAWLMRILNLPSTLVFYCAAALGLAGVGVILYFSRRAGSMIHCTIFCPIGLLANIFGRVSPFRLKIEKSSCTNCMRCIPTCRYGALTPDIIHRGKVGITCTLCGDCLTACNPGSISYQCTPWLSADTARALFLSLIISTHSVFLAVAMI